MFRDIKILFVDDEPLSRDLFILSFEKSFTVLTADDAPAAAHILRENKGDIAILVTDQQMAGQKGTDLLAEVTKQHPHMIRILTTAFADVETVIDAVNKGDIHHYVQKPWDIEHLRSILRNFAKLYILQKRDREILEEKKLIMKSLAANIAHELRTPLSTLSLDADYVKHAFKELTKGKEESDQYIDAMKTFHAMQNTIENSHHIINMLLTIAKNQDIDPNSFAEFSVKNCVEEAIKQYPLQENQKHIINLQLENDFKILGSHLLLRYVLFNLTKNALYAVHNADQPSILISLQHQQNENLIIFTDNGSGISEKNLPHIFEPFFSTKSQGKGTGIGLSFCKNVIESFAGEIKCQSKHGISTTFTMSFPI